MIDSPVPSFLDRAQQRTVLRAFSRALGQESHNLTCWPETAWQQVYNRLRFADAPLPTLLAPELTRRSQPGAKPWFRALRPSPESSALIRTLAGHTDQVGAVAWSPDGTRLASGSGDRTVRLWVAASGALLEMVPLRGSLWTVAFHPFEPRLAVGSSAGEVWIGDWLRESYGPLVVAAVDHGGGPEARCHACQQAWSVAPEHLGQVVECPTPGCDQVLRLNPFVIDLRFSVEFGRWLRLPWWRKLFTSRPTPPEDA